MLILVEGVDKAGKSTFIGHLSELTSIQVYRKIPPTDLYPTEYHSYFKGIGYATAELHSLLGFDLIIDRSFISDFIYSNKVEQDYPLVIWKEWEQRMLFRPTLLIFVKVTYATFVQRIRKSPDIYMDESDYEKFTVLYETYIQESNIPTIQIDGEVSFDEQRKVLKMGLMKLQNPLFEILLKSL